jgi:hypothetical protein
LRLKIDNSLFVLVLAVASSANAHGNLAFTGGNWFDGEKFVAKTMYSVDNVFRERFDAAVDRTIDLGGSFVIPPFADDHNHVLADGMDVDAQIKRYLRLGIFYVKNPNNTVKLTEVARSKVNKTESVEWPMRTAA